MGATLSRENGNVSIDSSIDSGVDSSSTVLIDSRLMSGYPYDALATGFVTVRSLHDSSTRQPLIQPQTVVAASFISAFSVALLVVVSYFCLVHKSPA